MARKKSGYPPPEPTARPAAKPAADQSSQSAEQAGESSTEDHRNSSGEGPPAGPVVVGVGASAGGLQAFKQFLDAMSPDSGLAFILTPHLAPQHESLLAGLLAQHTVMPVTEVRDRMAVEADHVYVIPPNKYLAIRDRTLHLSGPVGRHDAPTPIDAFLESLAVEQCERAICVVLSGSAPYGIQGLKAIKAAGGIVVVQEPATAEYDRMPKAAIATDLADFVLPIEQMPATLVNYSRQARIATHQKTKSGEEYGDELDRILALLRTHMKRDYRCYRKSMVVRRVQRRMCLAHVLDMPDYVEFLRKHPDEIGRLAKDLMVGVTSFFREPETFRELAARAIVDLVARKESDAAIRVWVPGCATGEEAYSIAMLVLEQLALARKACSLKVFASDIDEQALAFARQGVYHDNLRADIGGERLARFFTRLDEHTWQIGKQLREAVVFAGQDLLADAPFSKLDLISCRNLLIYLEPDVQPKVIALFHFALNEGGTLVIGPSETIARQTDLFEPLSKKWRIYRRLATARRERVDFPIVRSIERRSATARWAGPGPPRPGGLVELVHRALLAEYAPAAVVIDRQNQVLIFQGPTALYMEQPAGEPTRDLLLLAHPGLRSKLRTAVLKAAREERPVVLDGARVRREGRWCSVRVGVKPLAPLGAEGLLLVTFEEGPRSPPAADGTETIADETLFRPLEEELSTAREELHIAQEEMATSHEELRLVNEEAMSMNEELQSSNEELETSKEELQSLNEELATSNSQLQEKVEELESANSDVANLLASAELATICLDAELRIRWFTPASTGLLNLIAGDVGRPIGDIADTFTGGKLLDDAARVLAEPVPVERELAAADGRWYLRRILPYRASGHGIDGVVITFADVTQLKRASERSRLLATVLLDSNDAVLVLDLQGQIAAWNRGAEQMYGYSETEALRMNFQQLVPETSRAEAADRLATLVRGETATSIETQRLTKDGRALDVWLTVTVLRDEAGKPVLIAATERDVTEWNRLRRQLEECGRQLEAALHGSRQRTSTIVDTVFEGIVIIDERGTVETFNRSAERIFGYAADEIVGRDVRMLFPPQNQRMFDRHLAQSTADESIQGGQREISARRKDGSRFALEWSLSEMRDGPSRHYVAVLRDVSDRKSLEKEVLEIAAREQRRIGQDLHDGVGQALTGLGLLTRGLVEKLGTKSAREAAVAAKIAEGIKATVQEIRRVVRGLVPVEVGRDGLMAALNQLAVQTSTLPQVSCTFECPRPVDVTDNFLATHIYRIAQEAVTNAIRHGHARQIEISLSDDGAELKLEVDDDGSGMKRGADEGQGMGLRLMRYRAGLIGGICTIGPAEAGGTRVVCAVAKS